MRIRVREEQDRLDLWEGSDDVKGWVARQGTIPGLSLVDFNYPQHLEANNDQRVRAHAYAHAPPALDSQHSRKA